jgi:hypothetical protein
MLDSVLGSFTLKSRSSSSRDPGKIYWVSDKLMDFLIGRTELELWFIAHRIGWIVNFGG